ncbi:hypothetical protein [Aquimarina algicola]|uniref:Bacteriocin n=1 Tax=Aquimarina algicola TaxID=2589995 RepID=A0A504JM29_9FLAO|nr:hypothetical protein [Aquimarina algicola]TPN88723.1 hypothetical protein FHK87_00475 [Aquimarina algicola]
MIKNILNLDNIQVLKREQQKSINAGSVKNGCVAEFRSCTSDSDCPCGVCGVDVGGFFIPDLCAF